MERGNWYFTFGCCQEHAGHYVRIFGTFGEARMEMFRRHGSSWAFQYSEKQWNDMKNDPERCWEWPTELTEKVTKPCPVCGNVFLGNRYAGITDVCPSCLSKLKAAMKKGGETNGQIS